MQKPVCSIIRNSKRGDHNALRQDVASRIERLLPASFATEIAITGSTSRGTARRKSDLEINTWSNSSPAAVHKRLRWMISETRVLRSHGAKSLVFDTTAIADGSQWMTFQFEGISVELSCQSLNRQQALINRIRKAQITDHNILVVAEAIHNAIPIRSNGSLFEWKRQLSQYPSTLQSLLILDAAESWTFPLHISACWQLNGENRLTFITYLMADIHAALRVLFAVNKCWEPNWKRLAERVRTLQISPARVSQRIKYALLKPMSHQARATVYCFVLDVLSLVPDHIDVKTAKETIRQGIMKHHY